jgi:hypothetical protein
MGSSLDYPASTSVQWIAAGHSPDLRTSALNAWNIISKQVFSMSGKHDTATEKGPAA